MFKKISAVVVTMLLSAGIASASCFGPYCWDESGTATISALSITTLNAGITSKTLAQINALTPGAAGQLVYCNNGVNSAICVSSGTGVGAYVSSSSPTVHCDVR